MKTMETKGLSPSTANLIARLKPKPVKAGHSVPIEGDSADEHRRSRRKSACLQGSIHASRLTEPVACVIRNLSATGARVEIVKAADKKPFVSEERIPDQFTLAFRLERTEVDCEVVWQRGNALGVRFQSLPRQTKA